MGLLVVAVLRHDVEFFSVHLCRSVGSLFFGPLHGILGIRDVPEFMSRLTISAWLRCGAQRTDGCRWTAVLRCIFSLFLD